jgi:hypothetical protein
VDSRLAKWEAAVRSGNRAAGLTLILAFYEPIRQSSFFGVSETKSVWEEWVLQIDIDNEIDSAGTEAAVKANILEIVNMINEATHPLKPIGDPEDPNIIRYPFELIW